MSSDVGANDESGRHQSLGNRNDSTTYIDNRMTTSTEKTNETKQNNKTTQKKNKNNEKQTTSEEKSPLTQRNENNSNHISTTDNTLTWGNPLGPKDPNMLRLILQNIGGIDMADN